MQTSLPASHFQVSSSVLRPQRRSQRHGSRSDAPRISSNRAYWLLLLLLLQPLARSQPVLSELAAAFPNCSRISDPPIQMASSSSLAPPRVRDGSAAMPPRDDAEHARWKEGGRRDEVGLERRLARDIAGIVVSMDVSRKAQICEAHHRARRLRRLATAALVVAALAAAVALVLYLVYRPVRPQASVSRAAVYRLASANGSLSSFPSAAPAHALAASMQFTLLLHNPSDRVSLLYDGLVAYAAYRGEPVTPPAPLPPVVQDRGADVAMSPLLGGAAVPVSADTARVLAADCVARLVQLRLVVMGRVKYRSGPFRSGWRDLYVRCNVIVGLSTEAAVARGGDVPLLEYPRCAVDA